VTALEGRIERLELALSRLQIQLNGVAGQLTQVQTQARQGPVVTTPGGGGDGGGGAFKCTPAAAIAGGGSGTADVYSTVSGSSVLVAAGATVINPYLTATIAGRILTLGRNPDGTYQIYGQSCT
jgi:hypothetical protein